MALLDGLPALVKVMLSLSAWLCLLTALFVPLERAFAVNRQSSLRPQMLTDVGFFFLSGLVPIFILSLPLAMFAAVMRHLLPAAYTLWVIGLPIGLQILFALIVGEFGFYWGHRIMHQVPWLWRYHAIHHEPVRMDWLVNTRAHPIDIIFTRMFGLTLVNIVGFGIPGSGSGSMIPIIVLLAGTFWGFFIHANLNVRLGWIEHILSSPRFHHWHHSRSDHPNHNYASTLPIYDRIFGTYHVPPKAWPPSYGIAPENQPDLLGTQSPGALPAKSDATVTTKDVA
ncbi:sterol desaturase family protein [Rhizorhabdus argentea]|uniref:sterol desaturase family protein n=1 Tax=Rhizorhabdus argentea TaxID=1387174 RepID=UPI0030ED2254